MKQLQRMLGSKPKDSFSMILNWGVAAGIAHLLAIVLKPAIIGSFTGLGLLETIQVLFVVGAIAFGIYQASKLMGDESKTSFIVWITAVVVGGFTGL